MLSSRSPFRYLLPLMLILPISSVAASPFVSTTNSGLVGKVNFELIDNRIFINVRINGQGPFHLILDTGASLAVSPEVAQKAGLKGESEGETGGVGEKTVPVQSSHARSLEFGPVHLANLDCSIISTADSSYVFGRVPVDGYFGLEVFEKYVVRHDYLKHELSFYKPEEFSYTGPGVSVLFERMGNIPVISASFDGVEGKFGVDTGARSALILYGPFVATNKIAERYQAKFQGVSGWGIGGPIRSFIVRSDTLKFGNIELRGLIARLSLNKAGVTSTTSKSGLIGPDVLKQFVFICDYSRHRLIFEKNADFGRRDSYDRAGVWLSQSQEDFEVFDVIPGGAAAEAGLKVGERVLKIDGKSTSQLVLPQVRERWKTQNPGTTIKLQVQRPDGEKRSVTLVLKELV